MVRSAARCFCAVLTVLAVGCSTDPESPADSGVGGAGGGAGPTAAGGGGGGGGAGGGGAVAPFDAGDGGDRSDGGVTPSTDAGSALDGGFCPGVFCEDFETGVIDPLRWELKANNTQPTANIVSQAGLVAHGKYAAHFNVKPNLTSYSFIITKNAPAALRGHHYGRAYFMVTPKPTVAHIEYLFAGTTGFPQYKYLEVASAAGDAWQLTYVDLLPPTTQEDYHQGGKLPLAKWICLEWEFSDAPDKAAVSVDGKPDYAANFKLGSTTSGLVGGFASFGFGFYAWHPVSYSFDLYYDDLVLDTKPVGCL